MKEFNPNWASPPCDTILETLKEWGLSSEEAMEAVQEKLELSDNLMEKFLFGDFTLRVGMAKTLETWLGNTQEYWLERDTQFQKHKRRIKAAKDFVTRVQGIYESDRFHAGMDEIFGLKSTLELGNFAYVELIMQELIPHKTAPISMSGCLLAVTKPYADKFGEHRKKLYRVTFQRYEDFYGIDHAKRALGAYE